MQIIHEHLSRSRLGEPAFHRDLWAVPLVSDATGEPFYDLLEDALERGTARVTEVSEGGNVPELLFENHGNRPVFLLDGDALKGAKQNRVINLTILVPAEKTVTIPVSCVEQGRWAYQGRRFSSSEFALFGKARAAKAAQVSLAMAMGEGPRSDQGRIWHLVAEKLKAMGTPSPSAAMEDVYVQRSADVEDYTKAIEPVEGQTGVVYGLGAQVVGMELFDHPETLKRYLPKILRSCALDALEKPGKDARSARAPAVRAFLEAVARCQAKRYGSIGLGDDLRLQDGGISGGALVVDDKVLHLSAFATAEH
jgi:hypothetical protein